ncbi:MAG: hypothetical protein ITG02_07940 [Patulibacter sp.]|nr:hypothetical protein [Patulibacter sp.]
MSADIPLEYEQRPDPQEEWVRRACAWEAPRLPGSRRGRPRRWGGAATWQPADTALLSRHRSDDGQRTIITLDRIPPPGFRLEYDLGALHGHQLPGTQRLLAAPDDTWLVTRLDGDTAPEYQHLGWVEQAPFPMLEPLTLAHDPVTGRAVLVGGGQDPLADRVEARQHLGWLESFPVLPRKVEPPLLVLDIAVLRRQVDRDGWRHRYAAGPVDEDVDGQAIGGLLLDPRPDTVELRQDASGRVVSELLPTASAGGNRVTATARWTVAPLTWADGRLPKAWGARAAVGRGRRAVRGFRPAQGDAGLLGYARRERVPGWAPLYSGTHPVTGDQLLSPSRSELTDLGYAVDGILAFVSEGFVDPPEQLAAAEVPWGSRFGQGRRV